MNDICICSMSISDSHSVGSVMSSAVKTEVEPHAVLPSEPCRLNRQAGAVKNVCAENESRSLAAAGCSTSVTALPAGDLLLGPRRSGHATNRWACQ